MARVHHRKARKDYPNAGIKKGDMYYFAQIKTGPRSSRTIRQIAPIKASQLTSSEFLSTVYGIEEAFDGIVHDNSAPDALKDLAQQLRDLGQETQDKFDNMPDGLQQGDTGQMLEERVANCDSWADEIEQTADTLENTINEIENKDIADLEDLGYDPEAEDAEDVEEPSEEAVQEARDREITDAVAEAIDEANSANPGF